jgi:hypothetical protein
MAKLKLASLPSKEQIKQTLEQRLPQYKYSFRGSIVIAAKSSFVGAMVVPRKDGVVINGNFPSMGATLIYVLLLFGTGILVGLLIWFLVWKGGQDKVRDEVQSVLSAAFGVAQAA